MTLIIAAAFVKGRDVNKRAVNVSAGSADVRVVEPGQPAELSS